jgi:hypothetical protein
LRGRYWDDARHIFSSHTFHGAGADTFSAARLPYRTDQITARHAHGVIPQVAADLGVLGLIVLFGLALVWFSAAFKLVGARRAAPTRWLDGTGEDRLAAVTIMLGAVVFGIENSIDWSWYVPGVAYFGLIAAGWTLGHPEAHSPAVAGEPVSVDSRKFAIARAVLIAVVGLWIAWAVYQPVRAERKIRDGVAIAESNPVKALKLGQEAREIDPTSDEAAFLIATAQSNGGRQNEADATLLAVANEQPANPETWRRLAEFRLNTLHKPLAAIEALRPLLYTSPADINGTAMLIQARDARVKQLVKVAAEKERKRLEAQFDKLEKQLEALKNQPRPAVTPGTTQ